MTRSIFSLNGRSLVAESAPLSLSPTNHVLLLDVRCLESGRRIGGVVYGTSHESCLREWIHRHSADATPLNARTQRIDTIKRQDNARSKAQDEFGAMHLWGAFAFTCAAQGTLLVTAIALYLAIRFVL